MPQLGPAEILVILVVALLVFGPKRLPDVGRQVGRGLRELRKVQDTVRDEINQVIHHEPADEPPTYATTAAPEPRPLPGAGQHAPSRFRPAGTPAIPAPADASPTPAPPAPEWPPASKAPAPAAPVAARTPPHDSARPATDPAP